MPNRRELVGGAGEHYAGFLNFERRPLLSHIYASGAVEERR